MSVCCRTCIARRFIVACAAVQAEHGVHCCSDVEALARVKMLQDHFCTYQVLPKGCAPSLAASATVDCRTPTPHPVCATSSWHLRISFKSNNIKPAWGTRQPFHAPNLRQWPLSNSFLRPFLTHLNNRRQARAVPVVRISTAGFTRTLDELHDYLLQCMELAMADDP